MCGLCGLLGVTHWTEIGAHADAFEAPSARTARAERHHRVALVNAVLSPRRAKLRALGASSYLLSSATGRSEIVDDIQAVWAAVERVTGSPFDPLDESYMRAIVADADVANA